MNLESGLGIQGPESESQLSSKEGRRGVPGKEGHLGGTEVKAVNCRWEL